MRMRNVNRKIGIFAFALRTPGALDPGVRQRPSGPPAPGFQQNEPKGRFVFQGVGVGGPAVFRGAGCDHARRRKHQHPIFRFITLARPAGCFPTCFLFQGGGWEKMLFGPPRGARWAHTLPPEKFLLQRSLLLPFGRVSTVNGCIRELESYRAGRAEFRRAGCIGNHGFRNTQKTSDLAVVGTSQGPHALQGVREALERPTVPSTSDSL